MEPTIMIVRHFFDEKILVTGNKADTKTKDELYSAYVEWTEKQGLPHLIKSWFGRKVKEQSKDITEARKTIDSKQQRIWCGIILTKPYIPPPEKYVDPPWVKQLIRFQNERLAQGKPL